MNVLSSRLDIFACYMLIIIFQSHCLSILLGQTVDSHRPELSFQFLSFIRFMALNKWFDYPEPQYPHLYLRVSTTLMTYFCKYKMLQVSIIGQSMWKIQSKVLFLLSKHFCCFYYLESKKFGLPEFQRGKIRQMILIREQGLFLAQQGITPHSSQCSEDCMCCRGSNWVPQTRPS